MNTKNILITLVILIFIGAGSFYFYQRSVTDKNTNGAINSATFSCVENKTIQALFFSDKVELTLSDGRNMLLPQAVSASGARYANSDESFVFWNKGDTAFVEETGTSTFRDCVITNSTQEKNQIANPASVNCSKQGGNLMIQKRGDGGEYGLCTFEDGKACEEWALMRGNCPNGGIKTTGFDTVDQQYCAWSGGETFAVPNSVCTFKDGSKCSTEAFYNGTCSMSQPAEPKG